MTLHHHTARVVCSLLFAAVAFSFHFGATATAADVVMRITMVEDEDGDPVAAGKEAAKALLEAMGDTALKAVIVSECFEDEEYKTPLMEGLTSVLPKDKIFGLATYGSYCQQGMSDFDAVCLIGIGGKVGVATALQENLGASKLVFEDAEEEIKTKLHAGGLALAKKLPRCGACRLMILMADAHSPKNQFLVEGAQEVLGKQFAITGGSANKNAGQTFVYYGGKPRQDAALGVMLSGDFSVALSGRKAQDNDAVIRTAGEGAAEAMDGMNKEPIAVLSFNCAGRRGKLDNYDDELAAIQKVTGKDLPLFGCYCAGEIGPLDAAEQQPGVRCGGSGWHVMFTVIGR